MTENLMLNYYPDVKSRHFSIKRSKWKHLNLGSKT